MTSTTFMPFRFSVSSLKNSPVENAINASAISERKSIPSITLSGTRCRQNGPSRMPATMYAVTFGRCRRLVMRVMAKPANNITATEIITAATGDAF